MLVWISLLVYLAKANRCNNHACQCQVSCFFLKKNVPVLCDSNFIRKSRRCSLPYIGDPLQRFTTKKRKRRQEMAGTVFWAILIGYLTLGAFGMKLDKCPAGFFCAKLMRRSLTGGGEYEMPRACPRGTWSGAGAVNCTACAKGHYTWDEASAYCDRCESGHMCLASNVDPEPCPLGTYSAEPAQTCCKLCKAGSYTPRIASTGCLRCRPGTYCPANEVTLSCANNGGMSNLWVF